MFAVVGISIGITQRDKLFFAPVRIKPIDIILLFIADVEKARRIPNRSLCKTEASAYTG
jgi:hypothetical protein